MTRPSPAHPTTTTLVPLLWHRVSLGRSGRVLRGLAVLALIPGLLALLVSGFAPGSLLFVTFFAIIVALLTFLGRRRVLGDSATLEAGGVLRLPSGLPRHAVRAEQIEDAYEVAPDTAVLRLSDGRVIEVAPADEPPRQILAHLGATLEHRTLTAPLRGVLGWFTKGLLALLFTPWITAFALALAGAPAHWTALATVVLAMIAAIWVPIRFSPRVVIGADGIRVLGGLRARFVPYGEMDTVYTTAHHAMPSGGAGTLVVQTDNGPLMLPTIGQSHDQVEALRARIALGIENAKRRTPEALTTLDRGGRTLAEWRDGLRRAAVATGGFRDATFAREDLEAVLADPNATVERRVGAGLALRAMSEDEGRARVRVAAETSASPGVRIVLDAAAAEIVDDAALDDLLGAEAARRT